MNQTTRPRTVEPHAPEAFRLPAELVILCSPMAFSLLRESTLGAGVGAAGLLLVALGTLPQNGESREKRRGALVISLVLAGVILSALMGVKSGSPLFPSAGLALACAACLALPRLPAALAATAGTLGLLMMATLLATRHL